MNGSFWRPALAATMGALLAVGCASAPATGESASATPAVNAAAAETDIDPAALDALKNMGAYLRTLNAVRIEGTLERETVMENGLKIRFEDKVRLTARKPDRLAIVSTSDRQERQYFYNGKEFTLWAPRLKNYATVPAPATIGELADELEAKYGIEFPLVDLFRWGTDQESIDAITVAMDVADVTIDGAPCRQYAFRQEGLDWQIWIQKGASPLPRKLVITTRSDEARPQFEANYNWNLKPAIAESSFTFRPPAGAQKIVIEETAPEAGANEKEN